MPIFVSMAKKDIEVSAVRWIDTRFSLQEPTAGKLEYKAQHIEGAIHWDLEQDLSDMTKKGGRHPLPDQPSLTKLFRTSGLELDDRIIIYDRGGEPFAARAWWILKYAGFSNVSIALEGFEELTKIGFSSTSVIPSFRQSMVVPQWNSSLLATRDNVINTTRQRETALLLDARAAERYNGSHEPLDTIAGHIPGAVNFDWAQLSKDGKFDVLGEAAERLSRLANFNKPITVYCGSGVTAAPLFAMLNEKGVSNVRLYAGSYSDWIENKMPVETGINEMSGWS